MSFVLFNFGAIRIEVSYLLFKGNVWYFRRRIPDDVRRLYPSKKGQLFFSLKTGDKMKAAKLADMHARQNPRSRLVSATRPYRNIPGDHLSQNLHHAPGQHPSLRSAEKRDVYCTSFGSSASRQT
ncbi:DUF6538 domain-containing protein [Rhodovulum euryhalinum]|uniref:DUF6538 domain-containing protein n=1 Tax=Rhodovulum euryhalinum TaxID=35805 RepID=UPI001046B782|nr:DUF6538 domain-containing protein [Rhodovulum euryhalinum]